MRVLMLSRRDTRNPEGGGAEVYLETIALGLVRRGHHVTLFCAAHEAGAAYEDLGGVNIVRAGSKTGVHAEALKRLRRKEFGPIDVIVDVQNGMPFLSPLVARDIPTVVLVHHIHKEQWPVVYGPVRSRIGWFIESRVAPKVYRKCQYVAVSADTRDELIELGVDRERITVIHNGAGDAPSEVATVGNLDPVPPQVHDLSAPAPEPSIVVLGRLVPHKQVEHVFQAAAVLRSRYPNLTVTVVGEGWWHPELVTAAKKFGVDDLVEFTGFVSEGTKHEILSRAWVLAMPSLKEGWGIVIIEAARHAVPAVGYRNAGGIAESIVDQSTGLLVDGGAAEFTEALQRILDDHELRKELGENACAHSKQYTWSQSEDQFEQLLMQVAKKS